VIWVHGEHDNIFWKKSEIRGLDATQPDGKSLDSGESKFRFVVLDGRCSALSRLPSQSRDPTADSSGTMDPGSSRHHGRKCGAAAQALRGSGGAACSRIWKAEAANPGTGVA